MSFADCCSFWAWSGQHTAQDPCFVFRSCSRSGHYLFIPFCCSTSIFSHCTQGRSMYCVCVHLSRCTSFSVSDILLHEQSQQECTRSNWLLCKLTKTKKEDLRFWQKLGFIVGSEHVISYSLVLFNIKGFEGLNYCTMPVCTFCAQWTNILWRVPHFQQLTDNLRIPYQVGSCQWRLYIVIIICCFVYIICWGLLTKKVFGVMLTKCIVYLISESELSCGG